MSTSPLVGNSVFPPLYCICSLVRRQWPCGGAGVAAVSVLVCLSVCLSWYLTVLMVSKSWSRMVLVLWLVSLLIPTNLTCLRCLYILNSFSSFVENENPKAGFSLVYLRSGPRWTCSRASGCLWAVAGTAAVLPGRALGPWAAPFFVSSTRHPAGLCPATAGLWELRGQWRRSHSWIKTASLLRNGSESQRVCFHWGQRGHGFVLW